MNQSGSEFTLRVAICDLVERLKRMQHKCTYLEECRNQLVKEVIRLRLQNEWLARQVTDSPEITSLPQNPQCFCNQQNNLVNNTTYHTAYCHLNGQELMNVSSNDSNGSNRSTESKQSNKDESIHLINILNELDRDDFDNRQDSIRQLTIQMLKDLDNEMKTGQLKTDLINFVKSNLQADDNELIKFTDSQTNSSGDHPNNNAISNDYEAFNNNSDYYSNSHNLNVPLEELQYSQNAARKMKNENETSSTLSVNSSRMKLATESKLSQIKGKESGYNAPIYNSIDPIAQEQLISIISSVKNDIKYLYQGLLTSTDKLNKIKTSQLRHFFQKQINLDHSSASNTNATTIKHPQ